MAFGPKNDLDECSKSPHQSPENFQSLAKRMHRKLARLVSHTDFSNANEGAALPPGQVRPGSPLPLRCVSNISQEMIDSIKAAPPSPLLRDTTRRKAHVLAVRLEVDLHPMRLILSRLMFHPTFNRKGVFNEPVDPVALNLPDYHEIVPHPMDLGTVKRNLHAIAFGCREEAARDTRLVFTNAMRYNPAHNSVHQCANELLKFFDAQYEKLGPCVSEVTAYASTHDDANAQPPPTVDSTASADPAVSADAPISSSSPPIVVELPKAASAVAESAPVICTTDSAAAMCMPKARGSLVDAFPPVPKVKARLPPFVPHSCQDCLSRKCGVCKQGCLLHEPALFVCQGVHCNGAKVRKGSMYYVSEDGQRHYCTKCYVSLPPVLVTSSENEVTHYKQALLKRKNEEEIPELWIDCTKCGTGVHSICVMFNPFVDDKATFVCPDCVMETPASDALSPPLEDGRYSFVSGSGEPVPLQSLCRDDMSLDASALPKCDIATFMQSKVQDRMRIVPNAEKTITVRVLSDCDRQFIVPDVIKRHFRMATKSDSFVAPPSQVHFHQKSIALFQKIDGFDVCIFCMYVQEYDDTATQDEDSSQKRVYIAYIDSVEYFRPRECRTEVYREMLVSYLATARARGFKTVHIWACPPSRGNSFVFWNHPSSQRTPTRERLVSWYHGALSRAVECGVITDVKSLFESNFQQSMADLDKSDAERRSGEPKFQLEKMVCPPLLEGDFWIEETLRAHHANLGRIKVRPPTEVCVWNVTPLTVNQLDPCPVRQVAYLLKDRVMTHPCSVPFRRPVNAWALKIKNYHQVIKRPMDLGKMYARCLIGEYTRLQDVVDDLDLLVSNAKKFNPPGHGVHQKADEVSSLFYSELATLTKVWDSSLQLAISTSTTGWQAHCDMSMSLDKRIQMKKYEDKMKTDSVLIEDDRSSDGSRSIDVTSVTAPTMCSSESIASGPVQENPKTTKSSSGRPPSAKKRPKRKFANVKAPRRKLHLLLDGPDAVEQSMVGEDTWLLEKKTPCQKSNDDHPNKPTTKRRRSEASCDDAAVKRRRQSWLGEEVGDTVRIHRTAFFSCSLVPKDSLSDLEVTKVTKFQTYVDEFKTTSLAQHVRSSPIADARHSLLEFSQLRHLEFDTLRRAKYSTAVLLHHLHRAPSEGVVPECSSCKQSIVDLRWHKVKKTTEKRRVTKGFGRAATAKVKPAPKYIQEELCAACFTQCPAKGDFIPIPVSLTVSATSTVQMKS